MTSLEKKPEDGRQEGTDGKARLCALSDIPDNGVIRVDIKGHPALAVIKVGDAVYVMDDTCTHAMANLSEGIVDVDDGVIECPLHGGTFALSTGDPVDLPCEVAITIYDVEIRGREVFADLGAPDDS